LLVDGDPLANPEEIFSVIMKDGVLYKTGGLGKFIVFSAALLPVAVFAIRIMNMGRGKPVFIHKLLNIPWIPKLHSSRSRDPPARGNHRRSPCERRYMGLFEHPALNRSNPVKSRNYLFSRFFFFSMEDTGIFPNYRHHMKTIKTMAVVTTVTAETKKPNIFVIMTDGVGIWNISAYQQGMMVGRTPNRDCIAKESAPFFMDEAEKGPREAIFNFDDSANRRAVRVQGWKISFRVMEGNLLTSTAKSPSMPIVCNLNSNYKLPPAVPLKK